ncbi:MAG: pyridoxal phosphate-dependent aminotransferase [Candidatus Omnitrophota bacterium]
MELSSKVQAVKPSVTLEIAAKAKAMKAQGIDVISLSAGEPDFDTPSFIKDACIESLKKGNTKYTPVSGILELRQAICRKLKRDQGLDFSPDQIVVGCGAKHVIFNVLFALLNPGDEVLIPVPYWLSYPEMVTVLGGTNVFLPATEKTDFKITPDVLAKALTPKSKVLILNSPSNPTGAIYSAEELAALCVVLKKFPNVTVLSDEIYEKLVFDGRKHASIASVDPEIAKRTVIVNGHSKAYAMTGWRLGYAAIPEKALAKAVESIQSHSTSNPVSFTQPGGVVALDQGDAEAQKMCAVFQKRRDLFIEKLKVVKSFKPFKPNGAFYLFVDIRATGLSGLEVAKKLLDEVHVAVIPCEPFGSAQHIRMSYATSEKDIETAVQRIASIFK